MECFDPVLFLPDPKKIDSKNGKSNRYFSVHFLETINFDRKKLIRIDF